MVLSSEEGGGAMDEDSVIGAESTVAPDGKAETDGICDRWVRRDLSRERGRRGIQCGACH